MIKNVNPVYRYKYNQNGTGVECVNRDRFVHFKDDVLYIIENIENEISTKNDIEGTDK